MRVRSRTKKRLDPVVKKYIIDIPSRFRNLVTEMSTRRLKNMLNSRIKKRRYVGLKRKYKKEKYPRYPDMMSYVRYDQLKVSNPQSIYHENNVLLYSYRSSKVKKSRVKDIFRGYRSIPVSRVVSAMNYDPQTNSRDITNTYIRGELLEGSNYYGRIKPTKGVE